MKKGNFKIVQKHISLDTESMSNYIIIIELSNDIPLHTYLVPLPIWFVYYDPILKNLPVCQN